MSKDAAIWSLFICARTLGRIVGWLEGLGSKRVVDARNQARRAAK